MKIVALVGGSVHSQQSIVYLLSKPVDLLRGNSRVDSQKFSYPNQGSTFQYRMPNPSVIKTILHIKFQISPTQKKSPLESPLKGSTSPRVQSPTNCSNFALLGFFMFYLFLFYLSEKLNVNLFLILKSKIGSFMEKDKKLNLDPDSGTRPDSQAKIKPSCLIQINDNSYYLFQEQGSLHDPGT